MEKNSKSFNIAILSMFSAITFILMYTPLGTLPIFGNTVSIFHIPVLITSIILGLKEGLIIGFVAGFASLTRALLSPLSPMDGLYINPFVSIMPRMFIAITTYYSYSFIKKTSIPEGFKLGIPVVIGNLTNTFSVYFMLYLFYAKRIVADFNGRSFMTVISGLIATSTLIKTVIVVIITVPILTTLKKYIKRAC